MTKITYEVKDNKFNIEVKGHAGYAAVGNDIVCAAISVLIQTLINHMEYVTDEWGAWAEDGYAHVHGVGERAVESFNTIFTGFKLIAASYPTYVSIEEGCTMKKDKPLK